MKDFQVVWRQYLNEAKISTVSDVLSTIEAIIAVKKGEKLVGAALNIAIGIFGSVEALQEMLGIDHTKVISKLSSAMGLAASAVEIVAGADDVKQVLAKAAKLPDSQRSKAGYLAMLDFDDPYLEITDDKLENDLLNFLLEKALEAQKNGTSIDDFDVNEIFEEFITTRFKRNISGASQKNITNVQSLGKGGVVKKRAGQKWSNVRSKDATMSESKTLLPLVEARVKDIKAKYPTWDASGWLNTARETLESTLGAKGVSKYLLFWVREMEANFGFEEGLSSPEEETAADIGEIGTVLLDVIVKFQKNQQRMKEKDIYKYHAEELRQEMEQLGLTSREKKEKKKEEAVEGSEIVYENEKYGIFAVRPSTKEASCYYGRNTKWCISATQSRNYFGQYTGENKAFVMVRFDKINPSDTMHKVAIVYDADPYESGAEVEEVFDAVDDSHRDVGGYLQEIIQKFAEEGDVGDIVNDIIENGRHNVQENPPDVTAEWEKRAEEVEASYEDIIKHGYYHYEIEDGSMRFSGGFDVDFDNEVFEGGEYELPTYSDYSSMRTMTDGVQNALLRDINIYNISEVEIDEYDGGDTTSFRISLESEGGDPDGYDNFLENLSEIDDKYAVVKRVIEKYLMEEGYISKGAYEEFLEQELQEFGESLVNFRHRLDEDPGDEEVLFTSQTRFSVEVDASYAPYIAEMQVSGYRNTSDKYTSEEITKKVAQSLQGLNQVIVQYMTKQLELPIPNLPPRLIQKLSIPESLAVVLFAGGDSNMIEAHVELKIDDTAITKDVLDAAKNVVKFIDDNYDKVKESVISAVHDIYKGITATETENIESLPDSYKQILKFAQLVKNPKDITIAMSPIRNWSRTGGGADHLEGYFKSLFLKLSDLGEIPEEFANPFGEILEEAIMISEIHTYFSNLTEACAKKVSHVVLKFPKSKQATCNSGCDAVSAAQHLEEENAETNSEVDKYLSSLEVNDGESGADSRDIDIRSRQHSLEDIMDPDTELWE